MATELSPAQAAEIASSTYLTSLLDGGRTVKREPAHAYLRRPAPAAAVRDHRGVLRQAMNAHQADDLDTAARLYREVLELHAAQPDALHYLGVLCHQQGRSDEGVELIRTALKITPRHPCVQVLAFMMRESLHHAT